MAARMLIPKTIIITERNGCVMAAGIYPVCKSLTTDSLTLSANGGFMASILV